MLRKTVSYDTISISWVSEGTGSTVQQFRGARKTQESFPTFTWMACGDGFEILRAGNLSF